MVQSQALLVEVLRMGHKLTRELRLGGEQGALLQGVEDAMLCGTVLALEHTSAAVFKLYRMIREWP